MDIKIYQGSGEKQNLDLIKSATLYFCKKLFTKNRSDKINTIRIYLKLLKDDSGECFCDTNKDGKFDIVINIDRLESVDNIISTIAHELIHVNQNLSGRLYIDKKWWWDGKSYGKTPYKGLTIKQQYVKLPWETEAYDKERVLAKSFFNDRYKNPIDSRASFL